MLKKKKKPLIIIYRYLTQSETDNYFKSIIEQLYIWLWYVTYSKSLFINLGQFDFQNPL